jgi:hypothetical protein
MNILFNGVVPSWATEVFLDSRLRGNDGVVK